jgi:L-threonylcarbamoyladenylate synthase
MVNELPLDIKEQIQSGITILGDGGLVAFPTDTVYGLGACFDNPAAVEGIYRVKQRPRTMGLPLLVSDESQINEVVEYISNTARLLINRFLPGSLTLVMPRAKSVTDIVTGGAETVAIRIPHHPVPIALIKGAGKPIIGTSANLSGKPSALTADEVNLQFGNEIDLTIDAGRCEGGRESTIVDVTEAFPRLIREGAISRAEIESVCQII